jgi:predicted  nucleic acid-binding Zn-ribbon protein
MAKKTTKVEARDSRETFVSILTNFDDSENVEDMLKALYDLQKADKAIDGVIALRGELPEEVAGLEKEIAGLEAKLKANEEEITAKTAEIAKNKSDILDCDSAIADFKKKSETVSNSLEFDSLKKEIENQTLLKEIAEKRIDENRSAIASMKAENEDVKDRINIVKGDLQAKQEELQKTVDSTAKEEADLRKKRNACASKIDDRVLSAYERIRGSVKNKLAVVKVYEGNACGGCFATIIPQRLIDIESRKKLVVCENCGRIIVPDFDKPAEAAQEKQ